MPLGTVSVRWIAWSGVTDATREFLLRAMAPLAEPLNWKPFSAWVYFRPTFPPAFFDMRAARATSAPFLRVTIQEPFERRSVPLVRNLGGSLAATAPGASRHAATHATNTLASPGRLGRIAPSRPTTDSNALGATRRLPAD